ncbi:Ovochymase1like, partial [Caligus rogercresseyi]
MRWNQEIILGNTPVVLKSVGYPKSYKGLINCSFDMISSPNENITLSCSEFHVTGIGPKCIFGGLEVNMGSGGEEPEVICVPGYGHSKLKLSRRNKLRLRFYNKYFQNKGFYCQVQKVREPFKCRCGTKNVNRRIVGGKEVEENEYPWHIGITKIGSNRPFCGGALITDRHIATAGHCFNSINE